MSLDVLLEPLPERVKAKEPCKVGRIIQNLEPIYKLPVLDMLEKPCVDGGMSDEQIQDRFKRAGLPVSATVINRHRRGKCCCA
jgi:hypothetical protein